MKVLAVESFLADITRNVAGDRLQVDSLIPPGVEPHSFEPTPQDIAKASDSGLLILNGAGLETWMKDYLDSQPEGQVVVEASAGLQSRQPKAGEIPGGGELQSGTDPHFWMDPNLTIQYAENIRDALVQIDPEGKDIYTQNAENYIGSLQDINQWIEGEVRQIPEEKRLLVTDHESLGYFADRYGFRIIGTVIPSVSTEASPSAQQMASLIDGIRASGAPAVFLEPGANKDLAEQVSQETGIKVIMDLYTGFLSGPGGPAATYIDLMKHDVTVIVEALQ